MFDSDNPVANRLVVSSLLAHFEGRFKSDDELLRYIRDADMPGTLKYFVVGTFAGYHVSATLASCNLMAMAISTPDIKEWVHKFLDFVNSDWLAEPENRPSRRMVDAANLPEGNVSDLALMMADYIDRAWFDPASLPKSGFTPLIIPSVESADRTLGMCVGYVCKECISKEDQDVQDSTPVQGD